MVAVSAPFDKLGNRLLWVLTEIAGGPEAAPLRPA